MTKTILCTARQLDHTFYTLKTEVCLRNEVFHIYAGDISGTWFFATTDKISEEGMIALNALNRFIEATS